MSLNILGLAISLQLMAVKVESGLRLSGALAPELKRFLQKKVSDFSQISVFPPKLGDFRKKIKVFTFHSLEVGPRA